MSDLPLVLRVAGWSLLAVALAMLPATAADLVAGQPEWQIFALCALMAAFIGASMILSVGSRAWSGGDGLEIRPEIVSLVFAVLVIVSTSSLPFAFGDADCSPVDAVFEAVARATTSGR